MSMVMAHSHAISNNCLNLPYWSDRRNALHCPSMTASRWPQLVYAELKGTCETLQLFSQVVGKVRLAQTPWLNHSWHVPLYVTARGLGTSIIPHAAGAFDMELDFIDHRLLVRSTDGGSQVIVLQSMAL